MINNLIQIIVAVFDTFSVIDVRGYEDRKAVVKAQDGLIQVYKALEAMKKKEDANAEHSDCNGESGTADS